MNLWQKPTDLWEKEVSCITDNCQIIQALVSSLCPPFLCPHRTTLHGSKMKINWINWEENIHHGEKKSFHCAHFRLKTKVSESLDLILKNFLLLSFNLIHDTMCRAHLLGEIPLTPWLLLLLCCIAIVG